MDIFRSTLLSRLAYRHAYPNLLPTSFFLDRLVQYNVEEDLRNAPCLADDSPDNKKALKKKELVCTEALGKRLYCFLAYIVASEHANNFATAV